MMTVKQAAALTGVSVRTLQFYDEIGLLKPAKVTDAGYRLYDDSALEVLQQILFFKELDFTLKEIKTIMSDPHFDKTAAFEKQRELIQIKRDRLNALLRLLDRLIEGENCMEFENFDMSEYFKILTEFKNRHADKIAERFGSLEQFDEMISDIKSREDQVARMAEASYGSIEKYTSAMEKSLDTFLSEGPAVAPSEVSGLIERTEALTKKLTAMRNLDAAAPEVQESVSELIAFTEECSRGADMGENHWAFMAETYLTNPVYIEVNDKKYGVGASKFIGLAIQAYLDRQ